MSANFAEEPCIEFCNVVKTYNGGTIKALNDVNLSIRKGEIFGYIGPNGAGKTTSIKILVGLIHEFTGSVSINGHDLIKNRQDVHKLIGYLPQSVGFQEWRTVNHALRTFGLLSGVDSSILDKKIDDVLTLVGLPDVKDRKIVNLSGGMKQKLLLAQALLHEPEVLVLDEPMTGLDPSSRYQMRKIIQKLAEKDITIFFSSHILSDVQGIATQIGILNDGKILKVGTPEELQNQFKVGNDIEIVFKSAIYNCTGIDEITGVESVNKIASNKILVHLPAISDLDQVVNEILALIAEQKCKVLNFNVLKASLEDVYLKYVGGKYE